MRMGIRSVGAMVLGALLALAGCGYRETPEGHQRDANTPAGKVGQAAHKAATEAAKAGRAVGRELDKAAHDVHEGWKEESRKDEARKGEARQ